MIWWMCLGRLSRGGSIGQGRRWASLGCELCGLKDCFVLILGDYILFIVSR